MRTIDCITQEGIVEEVNNGLLKVNIVSKSLCASCHAQKSCTSLEVTQKQFSFQNFDPTLKSGDKVLLKMHQSQGPLAVFIAYIIPFIIFLSVLIILNYLFNNDLYSGLGSIFSIVLYYLIIKLFNKQLKATFTFQVERA